ncbi:hypothetical protein C8K58_1257, partial [Pseudomonas sp. GV047]
MILSVQLELWWIIERPRVSKLTLRQTSLVNYLTF